MSILALKSAIVIILAITPISISHASEQPANIGYNSEAWQLARSLLIENKRNHYQHNPFYAITSPELIDPIFENILERKYDGQMPSEPKEIKRIVRRVSGSYGSLKYSDVGRAFLEARMIDYFSNPSVYENKGILFVDFGMVPGKLEELRRGDWKVRSGSIDSIALAKTLQRLSTKYQHDFICAFIKLPFAHGQTYMSYVWDRKKQDIITAYHAKYKSAIWSTDKLNNDLSPFISGDKSLHIDSLNKRSANSKLAFSQASKCRISSNWKQID